MRKIFLFLFFTVFLIAENKPEKLVLAHEDKNAYPWVFYDKDSGKYQGLDLILLNQLGKELGVEIEYKIYPWSRCLRIMSVGEVDGIFASSYKESRLECGLYPMKDMKIDNSKKLHVSGYSLYVLKDSKVNYVNGKIINLRGRVGVQRSFSIAEDLAKMGVAIDDGTAEPLGQLRKLLYRRVGAVALQSQRADNIIKGNMRLKLKIKKLETEEKPFNQKAYFLMLSKEFYEKYPEFSEKIWDTVEKIRESQEFGNEKIEFYKNYP